MKFSPQIHLFLCLAMLGNMLAPAVVRADPPQSNVICGRINTPKASVDENERKQNRSRLFNSWKDVLENTITKQHRTGQYAAAAAPSIQAQNGYLFRLQSLVIEICEIQLGAELGMKELSGEISKTSALTDKAQMCGRFDQLNAIYKKSGDGMVTVSQEMAKRIEELKKFYVENANVNLHNLDNIPNAGKGLLVPGPVVERTMWQRFFGGGVRPALKRMPSLREEAAMAWGNNAKDLQKNFVPDSNSLFGGVVSRLDNDLKAAEQFSKRLEFQNGRIQELQKSCGITVPGQKVTADPASEQPDISGLREHPQKDADLDPNAGRLNTQTQPDPDPSEIPGSLTETPEGEKTPPYQKTGDEDVAAGAQPPPNKTEEEGWISRNKGLLITAGVGAAAVGGLLWYKKSQDKKAEKDAAALDAEARALASVNSNSSSGSSSTATSTSTDSTLGGTPANVATPQGSKFVLSGIPSSAVAVNSTLPEITIAIINPAGILTQDSHTQISVACAEPAGCSLTGTLTVQASVGKARFKNLSFTSSHESVKLIFSSPGFESVTSVSFGISGGGGVRE